MADRPVSRDLAEVLAQLPHCSRERRTAQALVTSPPIPAGDTGVLAVGAQRETRFSAHSFASVPNGAGDARHDRRRPDGGRSVGTSAVIVEASAGADHLAIVSGGPLDTSPCHRVREGSY